VLKQHGFDEAELAASWHGQKDLLLRDNRDAIVWRRAQPKAKAVAECGAVRS
jgi:hypothetical protein